MLPTIISILLCLPSLVFGVRPFTVEFVSYSHVYRPEYFEDITLRLYNNSGHMMFNGSAILSKELDAVTMAVQVIVIEQVSGRTWTLLNITTDACDLIETERKRKKAFVMLSFLFKSLRVFGTLTPDHCPVKKGEYYIKDFLLDPEMFPARFFEIRANSSFMLYHAHQQFYKGNFAVLVEMKNSQKKGTKNGNKK